jgi:hypothetical protein
MDTAKLQSLIETLTSLFKDDSPEAPSKDKKGHTVSVMTIQTGKGIKLKKAKKKPAVEEMIGE